jgi:hypothetical protein
MIITSGDTPVIVFLMVDATDDETAETGLSPAVEISKNGGAFNAATNSVTEISDGWYKVTLTGTETDTPGPLIIRATAAGADEWRDVHQVIDSLPASLADGAIAGAELDNIADGVLTRDWTSVSGEAARSVLNALRILRNKWSVSGTTLTVTEEDDSTPAWTAALTGTAGADPVTASDPT